MNKLSIIEFAKTFVPKLEEKYAIYLEPEKLIGKTVFSDRAGFACNSDGGTEMILESIENGWVSFKSPNLTPHKNGGSGWGVFLKELHTAIRLTKEK